MIEKNQGIGNLFIWYKLEFILINIVEFLDNFMKIIDFRFCKGFSDWVNLVKEGVLNDFKKNVDIVLVRLFKCVEFYNSKFDLIDFYLGFLLFFLFWIEVFYFCYNGFVIIQVFKFCKELEFDFNNYMVFLKVFDGIIQVFVDNNLILCVDLFLLKVMIIFIYCNKIW